VINGGNHRLEWKEEDADLIVWLSEFPRRRLSARTIGLSQ